MADIEKVIRSVETCFDSWIDAHSYMKSSELDKVRKIKNDALELLKDQEKKQVTLHKKHVITFRRNEEFRMIKLYEAICETLLDEGELFIARTDDHEKVDFVFYVVEGR